MVSTVLHSLTALERRVVTYFLQRCDEYVYRTALCHRSRLY